MNIPENGIHHDSTMRTSERTSKDSNELNGHTITDGHDILTCLVCSSSRLITGSISPRRRRLSGRFSLPACSTQFGKHTSSLCTLPIIDYSLHMLLKHGRQPDCHRVNLEDGPITWLQNGLFPSVVPAKTLHTYLVLPVYATRPTHPILLDLITLIIFSDNNWSLSLLTQFY
jgi:hypothetical protein